MGVIVIDTRRQQSCIPQTGITYSTEAFHRINTHRTVLDSSGRGSVQRQKESSLGSLALPKIRDTSAGQSKGTKCQF